MFIISKSLFSNLQNYCHSKIELTNKEFTNDILLDNLGELYAILWVVERKYSISKQKDTTLAVSQKSEIIMIHHIL